MEQLLTWEPKGPLSQATPPHALSMEEPVMNLPRELAQLLPWSIDELSPSFAEKGGFDPQRRPQGCNNSEGAHKA